MNKLNLAVIGNGFVGNSVKNGFDTENVNISIIDPLNGDPIETLKNKKIDISFICVPTPMSDDGAIDSSIVENVLFYLKNNVSGLIVLKSTVIPNIVEEFYNLSPDRFIYNPEFLVERTAEYDFINPQMHIFGGNKDVSEKVYNIYQKYSKCKYAPVRYMSAVEAAFVKYGINSFLASKVLWFNEYHDLVLKYGADWETVRSGIADGDQRVGASHTNVPGPDGKKFFAGACFVKDIFALYQFSKKYFKLNLIGKIIDLNQKGRSQYELDDREKAQKIKFDYNID